MDRPIDTILLTALPASGKSEVRRYLAELDPEAVREGFHMGETVQLDDYPYVHMMRRISEELIQLGGKVSPAILATTVCRPAHDDAERTVSALAVFIMRV